MRTRSTGGMSTQMRTYDSYDTDGRLQPQYCLRGFGQPAGTTSTMTDYAHPGYRMAQRRGEIILSPMSLTKVSQSGGTTSFSITHPTWGTLQYGGEWATFVAGSVDYGDFSSPWLQDQVLVQAYAKLKQSPILIGETLGDLGKTLDMLHHPFKRSRELLALMNKHRLRRLGKTAASAARAASSAWLEYRYGWKPVVLDCSTAIELARNHSGGNNTRLLVSRSSATRDFQSSHSLQGTRSFGHDWTYSGQARMEINRSVHAGVLYKADPALVGGLDSKLGYRPSDIASTAWERVPFSFVADWFVNVGDWIQAIVPVPGITVLGNWVTTVENGKETCGPFSVSQTVNNGISPITTYHGTVSAFTRTTVKVSRQVNCKLPSYPTWTRNPLSRSHQMDALSLSCNSVIAGLKDFAGHLRKR